MWSALLGHRDDIKSKTVHCLRVSWNCGFHRLCDCRTYRSKCSANKIGLVNSNQTLTMKQRLPFILVLFVFLRVVLCSVNETCGENRFLNNLNHLLNQNNLKIINGVVLRRKSESSAHVLQRTSICNDTSRNLMSEINAQIASLLKTHVLEFELSSMFANGNNSSV